MEKIKPIKRSPQLAPLSREHHDALLFVWKLRQGLKNDTSCAKLRKYTLWYWKEHTKAHFYQEEKILLPYMPAEHPWVAQVQNEHAQIRELVLNLDIEAEKETFKTLADLAERHIRWEERKLFAYLEEHLTQDQLNAVHTELEKHPVSCADWTDEFWVKK
ncbi:MAG TPA: hemerythrin domain-containing protein [Chitinophagaceae bacterium]